MLLLWAFFIILQPPRISEKNLPRVWFLETFRDYECDEKRQDINFSDGDFWMVKLQIIKFLF